MHIFYEYIWKSVYCKHKSKVDKVIGICEGCCFYVSV